MGLFDFFRKKKKQNNEENAVIRFDADTVRYEDSASRIAFSKGCCESICEADRQNMEAKSEYELVTAYLNDIEKIDSVPEPGHQKIVDMAKKIINLNEESKKYSVQGTKISQTHRSCIEPNEDIMPDEIKKMEENEKYRDLVLRDLTHLENEKHSLEKVLSDSTERHHALKKTLVLMVVLMSVITFLLVVLQYKYDFDTRVIILLVFIFGVAFVWYLIYIAGTNGTGRKKTVAKLNRAIVLLNKTKIKYVNITNVLDYCCDKYRVNNSKELAYHWKAYQKVKEEERLLSQTAELISVYEKDLVKALEGIGVEDRMIWLHQLDALIDPKEMVEVRHRLNVRRQKLRTRIDYNYAQADNAKTALKGFVKKHPEYTDEVYNVLKLYDLERDVKLYDTFE